VKRRVLIEAVAEAARDARLRWRLVRQGARHELSELDGLRVTIPRHRELNELTAAGIMKTFEVKLGKEWWRG
jgi:mRNA interferase HicA